jgi:hypothetical protein
MNEPDPKPRYFLREMRPNRFVIEDRETGRFVVEDNGPDELVRLLVIEGEDRAEEAVKVWNLSWWIKGES